MSKKPRWMFFSFAHVLKPLSDETYNKAAEKLLRELYLVVEDHKNNVVQEMTARSNQFGCAKRMHHFCL